MRISEIARTHHNLEHRHVGIHTTHTHVVQYALRLYTELGLDPTIEHNTLFLNVPKTRATSVMGMIERCTGQMAFNQWEEQ